jgi:hypothetical protein
MRLSNAAVSPRWLAGAIRTLPYGGKVHDDTSTLQGSEGKSHDDLQLDLGYDQESELERSGELTGCPPGSNRTSC